MKLDKFNSFVLSAWKGEQPLWAMFWVVGAFFGGIAAAFLTPLFLERLFLVSEFANNPENLTQPFFVLQAYSLVALVLGWLVFVVWTAVAIWRSAAKAKTWCWPVRIFVAAEVLTYACYFGQYAYALFF